MAQTSSESSSEYDTKIKEQETPEKNESEDWNSNKYNYLNEILADPKDSIRA
jgi:hypothetical protein